MTDRHGTIDDPHASVYAGLLGGDDSQWAFGTDFDDPLAGVDTTVPDGVDVDALAHYCLMLGDDALIMSQRMSGWCSRAPDLEEDVALANIALDLLGQARLLLARAAAADPAVVPVMPQDSPVPPEDALAFFRDEDAFVNVHLVEAERGDFATTVVRLLMFSAWRLAIFERLCTSRDHVLAAVAAKGVKEMTYHRDYSARWVVTLGQGTAESRRRSEAALLAVWPAVDELFLTHPAERACADAGVGVDPVGIRATVDQVLDEVLWAADLTRPEPTPSPGRTGRDGVHTPEMAALLTEMQTVARAHPRGQW